jgi:hypothetical protein
MSKLFVLSQHAAICQLGPSDEIPLWVQHNGFTAIVHTSDELTVVCAENYVPTQVKSEKGWRILKVNGPLEFSQVGVLSAIIVPLAQAGVSIFTMSTFDTDYVLVKEIDLVQAIDALRNAGHIVVMED